MADNPPGNARSGSGFFSGWFGKKNPDNPEFPPGLTEAHGGPHETSSVVSSEVSEDPEKRKSLWSLLADKLGMDITRVSLPLWLFEPLTILEKAGEVMEYASLLKSADEATDTKEALAFVAAFSVSGYVSSERTAKPFNPLLGETYEYIVQDSGFKFMAEQVSHHPPIMAAIGESDNAVLAQDSLLRTRFMGNYCEIYTVGSTRVHLKKLKHDYTYTTPVTCAHNLIIGFLWVDVYGEARVQNNATGEYILLKYNKSGWFGAGRHVVSGEIMDKDDKPTGYKIDGIRKQFLDLTYPNGEVKRLWEKKPDEPSGRFKFTNFARSLNAMDAEMEVTLPCTDARIRPDRLALEREQIGLAVQEKRRLEELQRADRRARGKRGWVPRYFAVGWNEELGIQQWDYTGKYWEEREERIRQYQAGEKIEENKGCIESLAVDYRRPPTDATS